MTTAQTHRVRVSWDGQTVRVAARKGVLLEADRAALSRHIDAIIAALRPRDGTRDDDLQPNDSLHAKWRMELARCEEPDVSVVLPSGERLTSCPNPDLSLVRRHPVIWESFTQTVAALVIRGVLPRVAERMVFSEVVGPSPGGYGCHARPPRELADDVAVTTEPEGSADGDPATGGAPW